MSTPESKVKAKVKEVLKKYGAYWHCPVQNGMGAPSLDFVVCKPIVITPDMVGKRVGLFGGVETKAGSKTATERQQITMGAMESAGGATFLVNEFHGMGVLEKWLQGENNVDGPH